MWLSRRAVPVNLPIGGLRFGERAATLGKRDHLNDPDRATQGQGNDAARFDRLAWPGDALAVDPDMAGVDQALRERSALHQPDAVEVTIDPQPTVA